MRRPILLMLAALCMPMQASARLYGSTPPAIANELEELASTCNCSLAIGDDGLRAALQTNSEDPVIAIFITATSFHQIQSQFPERPRVSALFAEANPAKNLALADTLVGRGASVLLYSDNGVYLERMIDRAYLVKANKESLSNVLTMLDRAKAVIAVPDSSIWTKDTFRISVMSLYEQNKVVIGFSRNLVIAGALASLYFEDTDYIKDLSGVITRIKRDKSTSVIEYPVSYKIAVNYQVAKSLGLIVPDLDSLMTTINKVARQ